jgi:hypothetical protein
MARSAIDAVILSVRRIDITGYNTYLSPLNMSENNFEHSSVRYRHKNLRHSVTSSQYYVKDIIQTEKGTALVLQALKGESIDSKHRIFTAPLWLVERDYEIET